MKTFTLKLKNGETIEVKASEFSVTICGSEVNFLLHKGISRKEKTITEKITGMRVMGMSRSTTIAEAKVAVEELFTDIRKVDILKRAISAHN